MSGKATMKSFKQMLDGAKPHQRTVPICLRGDLVGQIEDLERQLADAEKSGSIGADSIESEPDTLRLAREIEDLRTEMQDSTYTFVLQALRTTEYRALKDKHPPRENDEGEVVAEDRVIDANYDTFLEPLLRACCVDPVLDDETWAETEPKLSDNQYTQLLTLAYYANAGTVNVPFSRAASRHLQKSDSE